MKKWNERLNELETRDVQRKQQELIDLKGKVGKTKHNHLPGE